MRENPLKVRRPAAVAGAGAFSPEAKALLHGGSSTECDRHSPASPHVGIDFWGNLVGEVPVVPEAGRDPSPQYPNGMAPLVGLKAVLDAMSNDHTAAASVPRAEHNTFRILLAEGIVDETLPGAYAKGVAEHPLR